MSLKSIFPDRDNDYAQCEWRCDIDCVAHDFVEGREAARCGAHLSAQLRRIDELHLGMRDRVSFCAKCWEGSSNHHELIALDHVICDYLSTGQDVPKKDVAAFARMSLADVNRWCAIGVKLLKLEELMMAEHLGSILQRNPRFDTVLQRAQVFARDGSGAPAACAGGRPQRIRGALAVLGALSAPHNTWQWRQNLPDAVCDRDARAGGRPQRIRGVLLDHARPMTEREIGLRLRIDSEDVTAELQRLQASMEVIEICKSPSGWKLTGHGRELARRIRAECRPRAEELEQLLRKLAGSRGWRAPVQASDDEIAQAWFDRRASRMAEHREFVALARPIWAWIAARREAERAREGGAFERVDTVLEDRPHRDGGGFAHVPLEGGALEALARCPAWCHIHVVRALEDVELALREIGKGDDRAMLTKLAESTKCTLAALLEKESFSRAAEARVEILIGAFRTAPRFASCTELRDEKANRDGNLKRLEKCGLLEADDRPKGRWWRLTDAAVARAVELLREIERRD